MAAITKKTTIGEVLNRNLETAKFFMEIGMHCLGCPASQGESIEEVCIAWAARHRRAKALRRPAWCMAPMRTNWLPSSTHSWANKDERQGPAKHAGPFFR